MEKRSTRAQGMSLAGSAFLLAVWLSPALAQAPVYDAWSPPEPLAGYLSRGTVDEQSYEGTLYCLRCDFSSDQNDRDLCRIAGDHRHVLVTPNGETYPLYGVTQEIDHQVHSSDRHHKPVRVLGRYFPATNTILVSSVEVHPAQH